MIDLVALPVWVNTLIERFHFDAQRTGAIATAYLACAVVCSVSIAPLIARLPGPRAASPWPPAASRWRLTPGASGMLAAHATAGIGVGSVLSVARGAIGRTATPHHAMIFTHTFLFGQLARLDKTGRAVAHTPAMLMAGSAVGPLLGGMLIVRFGFGALGFAAVLIGLFSFLFFSRLRSVARTQTHFELPPAH
ncbi:hypothetical protein FHX57_007065 [Paraburkholderia tropica]|uniref:hypothetical protein n=1 Tax=Paraburkholderia tropica TaxID=92647 RepID=UPI00184EBDDA|nr:hypothetical protein [Paraburkholderia tropica]MBB3004681.1 hypothetical protein [Paraburkholderia tropica]MBB6323479.1 hypothetical protein [Paraburkholderia tropica]